MFSSEIFNRSENFNLLFYPFIFSSKLSIAKVCLCLSSILYDYEFLNFFNDQIPPTKKVCGMKNSKSTARFFIGKKNQIKEEMICSNISLKISNEQDISLFHYRRNFAHPSDIMKRKNVDTSP
jgi:hypothetical protein